MREDVLPLVGFIAVAGPPPLVAAAVLVLGVLMLAGPFLVIVTLVAAMALAVAAVALAVGAIAALAVSPFVAVRHLRAHRPRNPFVLVAHRTRVAS